LNKADNNPSEMERSLGRWPFRGAFSKGRNNKNIWAIKYFFTSTI